MQTINQTTAALAEKLKSNSNKDFKENLTSNLENKYSPVAIQAATAKVLKLFAEFKKEYDGLVDYKAYRYTAQAAREWAVELLESGVNKEQFEKGAYQAIKRQKYPPERAYTFIELCRDGEPSQYPEIRQAYMDAANQNYGHEVIYESAKRVGFWELKSQAESVTYKRWKAVYPEVCKEHAAGASFKLPKSHQIEHKHIPAAPDSPVMSEWEKFAARFKRGNENAVS